MFSAFSIFLIFIPGAFAAPNDDLSAVWKHFENLEAKFSEELMKKNKEVAVLTTELQTLKETIPTTTTTWSMTMEMEGVPLGTIVAWTPQMVCTGCFYVNVPEGWQRCDGSVITDENSPWVGLHVPDLNLEERFLRGGPDANVLSTQDDQMQDHGHLDEGHTHTDSGHTHTDSGHTHSDAGHSHGYYDYRFGSDGDHCDGRYWKEYDQYRTTNTAYAQIRTSYANIESGTASLSTDAANVGMVDTSPENDDEETVRVGSETRPKSMYVVWIVKVAEYIDID